MAVRRPGVDPAAVERAIADLIRALALDPALDPELAATPARVAEFYREAFAGCDPAAEPELAMLALEGDGALVAVREVPFHSLCVHHFAPFFGHATVAYLPGRRLVGISGVARLVDYYARRPQLQERMTSQIADHLERVLEPRGVAVQVSARHLCMEMRGIRKGGLIETRLARGELAEPRWAEALRTSSGGDRG